MRKIRFQGKDFIFTGESPEEEGAIASVEGYQNGRVSFAHLFEDGRIMQFGKQIGTREDIEFLEETEAPIPTADAIVSVLLLGRFSDE